MTRPLTAAFPGMSRAQRSAKAKAQLRDRFGRWIEMGGIARFRVSTPGAPGGGTWYHGTVEAQDVSTGKVTVRLEDGRLVSVPNSKMEQPKAVINLKGPQPNVPAPARPTVQSRPGYSSVRDQVRGIGVDDATAARVDAALSGLYERYGVQPRRIESALTNPNVDHATNIAYIGNRSDGIVLGLNPNTAGNAQLIARKGAGGQIVSTTIEDIVTHEYGHLLDASVPKGWSAREKQAYENETYRTLADTYFKGDAGNMLAAMRNLSAYAGKDPDEMTSEMFASYHSDPNAPDWLRSWGSRMDHLFSGEAEKPTTSGPNPVSGTSIRQQATQLSTEDLKQKILGLQSGSLSSDAQREAFIELLSEMMFRAPTFKLPQSTMDRLTEINKAYGGAGDWRTLLDVIPRGAMGRDAGPDVSVPSLDEVAPTPAAPPAPAVPAAPAAPAAGDIAARLAAHDPPLRVSKTLPSGDALVVGPDGKQYVYMGTDGRILPLDEMHPIVQETWLKKFGEASMITAAAGQPDFSDGAMIALPVPPGTAARLAHPDGLPPGDLHVTLAYLGDARALTSDQRVGIHDAAREAANVSYPLEAQLPAGSGTFNNPDEQPYWLDPGCPAIHSVREHLMRGLESRGLDHLVATNHPFTPHITIKYLSPDEAPPLDHEVPSPAPATFTHLQVVLGDELPTNYPLGGTVSTPAVPEPLPFEDPLPAPLPAAARSRVRVSPRTEQALRRSVELHNRSARLGSRASLEMVKAVYTRGGGSTARISSFLRALSTRSPHPDQDLFPSPLPASTLTELLSLSNEYEADEVSALAVTAAAYPRAAPEHVFHLGRALSATAELAPRARAALAPAIRALIADGNSAAARSLRAKRQLRDRFGKWIEMGGGIRFKIRSPGSPGGGTWYHGRVEGIDVPNGRVDVRLEDGSLVKVPADKVEQPKAILNLPGRPVTQAPEPDDPNAPTVDPTPATSPTNATDPTSVQEISAAAADASAQLGQRVPDDSLEAPVRDRANRAMEHLISEYAAGNATPEETIAGIQQVAAYVDAESRRGRMSPAEAEAFRAHGEDLLDVAAGIDPAVPVARLPETPPAPSPTPTPTPTPDAPAQPVPTSDADMAALPIDGPSLTRAQRAAIEEYRLPDNAAFLNEALRNGDPLQDPDFTDPEDRRWPQDIHDAFTEIAASHRLSAPLSVYRGTRLDAVPAVGDVISQSGWSSVTLNPQFAEGFAGLNADEGRAGGAHGVVMEIAAPAGQPIINTGHADVAELVLPPDTRIRVDSVEDRGGVSHVKASIVPSDASAPDDPAAEALIDPPTPGATPTGPVPTPVSTSTPAVPDSPLAGPYAHARDLAGDYSEGSPLEEKLAAIANVLGNLANNQVAPDVQANTLDQLDSFIDQVLNDHLDDLGMDGEDALSGIQMDIQTARRGLAPAAPAPSPSPTPSTPDGVRADAPELMDALSTVIDDMRNGDTPLLNRMADDLQPHLDDARAANGDMNWDEIANILQEHATNLQELAQDPRANDPERLAVVGDQLDTLIGRITGAPSPSPSPAPTPDATFQEPAALARARENSGLTPYDELGPGDFNQAPGVDRKFYNSNHNDAAGNPIPAGWRGLGTAWDGSTWHTDDQGNFVLVRSRRNRPAQYNMWSQDNLDQANGVAKTSWDDITSPSPSPSPSPAGPVDQFGNAVPDWAVPAGERQVGPPGRVLQDYTVASTAPGANDGYNVTVGQNRGRPIYVVRQAFGARQPLGNLPSWQAASDAIDQDRARNGGARDAQQARAADEVARRQEIQAQHEARVRAGVDDQDRDLPDGWSRDLTPEGQTIYTGPGRYRAVDSGNGNLTLLTRMADGGFVTIGDYPNWAAVQDSLNAAEIDLAVEQRMQAANWLEGHGFSSDVVNAVRLLPDPNDVAEVISSDPRFVEIMNAGRDANNADVMTREQRAAAQDMASLIAIPRNIQPIAAPDSAPDVQAPAPPGPGVPLSQAVHDLLDNFTAQYPDQNALDALHEFVDRRDPTLLNQLSDQDFSILMTDMSILFRRGQLSTDDKTSADNLIAEMQNSRVPNSVPNISSDPAADPNAPDPIRAQGNDLAARGALNNLINAMVNGENPDYADPSAAMDAFAGRRASVEADLAAGDNFAIVKPPGGNEVTVSAADAVELLAALDRHGNAMRAVNAIVQARAETPTSSEPRIPSDTPNPFPTPTPAPAPAVPRPAAPRPNVPAVPPGAPAGQETRYHRDGVVQDRNGNAIHLGVRVRGRRDGAEGFVVAVQEQPAYARIEWDDGRRQVRAAGQLDVTDPAAPAAAPAPAAPAAPAPPPAPPAPARWDARAAGDGADAIVQMHARGANRGFPLQPDVGQARQHMESAVRMAQHGDPMGFEAEVRQAIAGYDRALGGPESNMPPALREDVAARRTAAAHLLSRPIPPAPGPAAAPALAPAPNANAPAPVDPAVALANLRALRAEIPSRIQRGVPGSVDVRNAGFALDDAISAINAGNPGEADTKFDRAAFLLSRAARLDLVDRVRELRAQFGGQQPAPGAQPQGAPGDPVQFLDNPFPNGRAPIANSGDTPNVKEPVTIDVAANPNPGQTADEWAIALKNTLGFDVSPGDEAGRFHVRAPEDRLQQFFDANFPDLTMADYRVDEFNGANINAQAVDFANWGDRAGEIARAARNRPAYNSLFAEGLSRSDRDALVEKIFGADNLTEFGSKGYRLQLNSADVHGRLLTASFGIYDADGNNLGGTLQRQIRQDPDGTISAYNAYMQLPRNSQKSGFADAFNRYMENWYIANNVTKVRVSAGLSAGGFVWALNGFNWDDGGRGIGAQARSKLGSLKQAARTDAEKAQVDSLVSRFDAAMRAGDASMVPTPMEIALVGWRPGLRSNATWLGKKTLLGTSWSGVKELTPSAVNQQQRQGYELSRRANGRAQQGLNKAPVSAQFKNALANPAALVGAPDPGHISQLQDVLSRNASLAELPLGTKRGLRTWVSARLSGTSANDVSTEDLMTLDAALRAEERADYPDAVDLGVGEELRHVTVRDLQTNSVDGWEFRNLGHEGGVNSTWKATHKASGQVYFVKNDTYAAQHGAGAARNAEHDVNVLIRGAGWHGVAPNAASAVEPDLIIQQRVGDSLDLQDRPRNAANLRGQQIHGHLANFDDALRMVVLDTLIGNIDRHVGNWQAAQGRDGRWYLFPIDHGLSASGGGWSEVRAQSVARQFRRANGSSVGSGLRTMKRNLGSDGIEGAIIRVLRDYRASVEQNRGQFLDGEFAQNLLTNLDQFEAQLPQIINSIT